MDWSNESGNGHRDLDPQAGIDWAGQERPAPSRGDSKPSRKAWRRRLRRRERIQLCADAAVEQWEEQGASGTGFEDAEPDIAVHRKPARKEGSGKPGSDLKSQSFLPNPRRGPVFNAGLFRTLARLVLWFAGGFLFFCGVAWDFVHGRNTQESRARRVRLTLESMGTTFIKIGQQLSMRLDLLPYAYTCELEKLLDNVPPFPADVAVKTIERTSGFRLDEIFATFDTQPIGSASISCVYQAVLRSGEHVAVKVRRPDIGVHLAADMRAIGWLLKVFEILFLTPGFTDNFVRELRTMLFEELDFIREARFADLYRHRMRKTRQMRFVSVPRVFFDYSSDEVMVSEFVTGMWMTDVLSALETRDPEGLARLDEMRADPIILARRIQLIARFNNFENIFFHADLHPANILIKPGNKIVLIDFGSCGSFSKRELSSWRRWFDAQSIDDVGGMVQAALAILEPLPPIDREGFGMRLEAMFWDDLYAIKSKHSDWSERISSRMWLGFLRLSQEFQIPMRLNTLRMIRASMLSDTIAARLDNDQDPYREFRYYEKGAGRRAKRRVLKRVHHLLGPGKFIRIEAGVETAVKFVYQVQRAVDSLSLIRIGDLVFKLDYFLTLLLKHMVWAFGTAVLAALGLWGLGHFRFMGYHPVSPFQAFVGVLKNGWWQILAVAPAIIIFWRMSFRLKERRPWN